MEVNSLGLFWISMAPQIQGMSTVVDRRGGSGPFSQLAQELYVTEEVDIRAQNAGLLRKYFVVLLSYVLGGHLLAAGFHYFVFVETRVQIARLLGKYFVVLLRLTIRCALFGEYVDEVHRFLGSGYMEQSVVVIQLAKVKFFRGQVGLQNIMHATRLFFNPDLSEVVDFKNSMIDQGINGTQPLFIANEGKGVSLEDDFMRLTRRCTIDELHDKEEGSFVVFGFVRSIVDEGPWWYSACVCGKSIQPQCGAYYCDFCQHYVTNVTPRYRIKIAVEDDNDMVYLCYSIAKLLTY
nr:uncharacterized protein LOC112696274 isoform X8 [Arachis hypogaea]